MSEPDSATVETAEESRKPGRRWTKWRYCRWAIRIFGLVVIGLLVAGWFFRGWITERATGYVERRLQDDGVHFVHGDVAYEITRGIVVNDLTLFETEAKKRPVLTVSNVAVDFGLQNLLSGEGISVKSAEVTVEDAELEFFHGERVARITGLQFHGKAGSEHVEVIAAEGVLNGLHFRASGDIWRGGRNRGEAEEAEKEEERDARNRFDFSWMEPVGRMVSFASGSPPPHLKLDFAVDQREGVADPLRVEGRFEGQSFRWRELPLDEAMVQFAMTGSDRMVTVSQVDLRYGGKPIGGRLRYGLESRLLEIDQLVSEVDLVALLGEEAIGLGEKLEGIRVREAPRLVVHGEVPIEDALSSAVSVTCERAGTIEIGAGDRPLALTIAGGEIQYRGGTVNTEKLSLGLFDGTAEVAGAVNLVETPAIYEGGVVFSGMLLESILAHFDVETRWKGPVSGSFAGMGGLSPDTLEGTGEIRFAGEGGEISGPFSLKESVVATEGLSLIAAGGTARVVGQVDTASTPPAFRAELGVEAVSVQSLLNLVGSGAEFEGTLTGNFSGSGTPSLEGISGVGDIQLTAEAFAVSGPLALDAGELRSENLSVGLGGGRVGIAGKVGLSATPMIFDGNVEVDAVPVQSIIDLSGSDKEVEGLLYGQYRGTAGKSVESLTGSGSVRVEDGKLYSVPLFGQMKTFLAGVLPTFGKVERNNLAATFAIREGVLETDNLVAASDMTRIEIDGGVNLVEQTADFTALAKVEGVVGVATNVVSKLLELEASGPIADLDIRLRNNAAEMAAGAVKGTVGVAREGVSDLTKGARNVGESAVKAGADGVKRVGKGLGRLLGGKGKGDKEAVPPPADPVESEPVPEAGTGETPRPAGGPVPVQP